MVAGWKLKLIKPKQTIKKEINTSWSEMLVELAVWIENSLVKALVFGGMGIQGIAQTDFYKFVSSPQGISQLGINKNDPPKLLKAYEQQFKVKKKGKLTLAFQFGDEAVLKIATQHPGAGTGKLQVTSWLEWVLDGKTVSGVGFVPRKQVPPAGQDEIRVNQPLGGLMLPKGILGSTGNWQFPPQLQDYDDKWFRKNVGKIEMAITTKAIELFQKRLMA